MKPIPADIAAAIDTLARPVCAYLYDTRVLADRVDRLRAALPAESAIYYAMKANRHPALLHRAARVCDGIEVASGGELAAAVAARPGALLFAGPAKTDAELDAALDSGVGCVINVESPHELRRLDLLARRHRTVAAIALRVNRAASTPTGSHRMTGVPTPFGIDEAQLPQAIAAARSLDGVRLSGLHLHGVSNNLVAAAHARFIREGLEFARRLDTDWETVNLGGGLGVDHAGPEVFDLDALAVGLEGLDAAHPRLVVEPGRFLAADAAWYAAEVIDLKRTHGRDFAVLRGGTHHFRLPAAWGYDHPAAVHPIERWDYPWRRPELSDTVVDVVGELCTPRDVLCRDLHVKRLRVGDALVFGRTGAYGWDISHHDFLSHPHPDHVVVA